VQPDVSLRGITGLETVLSGVFIEGSWATEADVVQYEFYGLERPPLTSVDQRGTQIQLRTRDGSAIAAGAPILHKGIKVGFLETPRLTTDGQSVIVDGFVEAPFDRHLTSATRFWDTSGFNLSFGTSGVELDVNSIASLIEGGVAFDTVVSGGRPVSDGANYDIYINEETARESLFGDPNLPVLKVAVLFDSSVNGLTKGSEVRFQGIRIGEVAELSAIVIEDKDATTVRLRTVLALEPGRLGMGEATTPEDGLNFLSDFVLQGLRARLSTGNILSGSLNVELVEVENAPPGVLDLEATPYPIIPSTASRITDVADSAEDVLDRINNLPVEELFTGAIDLMDSLERLSNDENIREVPTSLIALLDETRDFVKSDDLQAIPNDLRSAIAELSAILNAAQSNEIVPKLNDAIESAQSAAANLDVASEVLPAITAELEQLAQKANALELEALIDEATRSLAAIDGLLTADGTQDIPAALNGALMELRLFLGEVREGGAVENVNAALASASSAAKAIEDAATSLPALSERASALVRQTQNVVSQYGERSRFNSEAMTTLRDIQAAADAISSLARAIQRNPNSLLTGR
jgi:paraquat-inducible protein B